MGRLVRRGRALLQEEPRIDRLLALAAVALALALGAVAYEWNARVAAPARRPVQPVQAVTAAPAPVESRQAASQAAPLVVAPAAPPATSTQPEIVSISLRPSSAGTGEVVDGTVRTSSNVASVEARVAGYSASLEKVGIGRFRLSYTVPALPPPLHRTFDILFIARDTTGKSVSGSAPLTIR